MKNKCEAALKCERFSKWKAMLFLGISLAATLLINKPVSAQMLADVAVTATVLPARYIMVDKNHVITKIISNTKDDITPQVCLDSCQEKVIELTPRIKEQYQSVMATNTNSIGIIYPSVKRDSYQKLMSDSMRYITTSFIATSLVILL